MEIYSIWQMLEVIANLILSSPIFIISLIGGVILLIAMIVSIKSNKKMSRLLTITIYVFLILFVFLYYNSYFYTLVDNFVNTIFTQLFFPNLATYILMLIITVAISFFTLIKKKPSKILKIINLTVTFIIIFLFFLTVNSIIDLKINIYEPLTVYSNKTLLILIEFNMILFTVWILFLLSVKIVKKLITISNEKITNDKPNKKENTKPIENQKEKQEEKINVVSNEQVIVENGVSSQEPEPTLAPNIFLSASAPAPTVSTPTPVPAPAPTVPTPKPISNLEVNNSVNLNN